MRLLSSFCTVPHSIKNLSVYHFVIVALQAWLCVAQIIECRVSLFSANYNLIFFRIKCLHQQGILWAKVNLGFKSAL